MPIEHRPLLGVSEAAALTGLDEKIVRQAIRQGELIACYAHSSTKRIRRRDLDDWISSLPERPNRRARRIRHGPRMAPSSRAGVVSFPDVSTP